MKSKHLKSLCACLLASAWAPAAQAAYTITFEEVGGNVVATGSGALNLSALTSSRGLLGWPNTLIPYNATVGVGPLVASSRLYSGTMTFPASLGSGGLASASGGTGNFVGSIAGSSLMVPLAYVSGADLGTSETTFAGRSFADLGLTPGRYVWSWGEGATADTFTVQIGPPPSEGKLDALMLKVKPIARVGTSLSDKLALAEAYFEVPDLVAACSMMSDFLAQVRALAGKKFTDAQAADFTADAMAVMTAKGCD